MFFHFLTAAVAGPALVYAGAKYPGSAGAKLFLMGTGVVLTGTSARYFLEDARPALQNGLSHGKRGLEAMGGLEGVARQLDAFNRQR